MAVAASVKKLIGTNGYNHNWCDSLSERTVFINGIPALYEALTKAGREEEAKKTVKDFLSRTFFNDLDAKVERFRQIPTGIFLADEPYFKIFWEFNQIYIAGLYYSTVTTAGVLCERVCLDILTKNKVKHKKEIKFVKMIEVIRKTKLAKEDTITEMTKIRKMRNKYVHPKMTEVDNQQDALDMVKSIAVVLRNECSAT